MQPKEIFNKLQQVITLEHVPESTGYWFKLKVPTSEDAFESLELPTTNCGLLWCTLNGKAVRDESLYSIPISKLCRVLDGLRTMKIVVYGKSVRDIRVVQSFIADMLELSEYIKELPSKYMAYYDSKLRGLCSALPGLQIVYLRQAGLRKLELSWEQVFPCEDIETIKR
jgi:hypothetical protein